MRDASAFSKGTCKAVVVHGVGRATIDEVTIPTVGPMDVAIQVAYVGVCRTDLEIVAGTLGYYRQQIANYPIVPGHEVSGRVVATGSSVSHLTFGNSVVIECIQGCGACHECGRANPLGCRQRAELGVIHRNGGYSQFIVVPSKFVHRIPSGIDLQKACLCEPLAVSLKGLGRLASAWGDSLERKACAVIGAGPLGRLCAMVLDHGGHAVTIFDHDPRRLAGVGPAINTSQALDALGDFDVLIEATGEQSALECVLEASRAGAMVLLLGLPYQHATFSFERIVAYDKTVIGSVGSGAREFTDALALLPALDTSSFTQTVLPLEAFEQGWEFARTRSHLKVLLAPGSA